ncbi:hypothetical protein SAMN05892877_104222 [Rhizobium subbaraonis]|uniref:Uncharacterized protein n=1 Tax=Rhizobium subbaraonis TaxID=908946 RepID=A0A285U6W5_9HYPH|nr:hypothetical protein SAMN05892877_104222 [Rhizobium subbaraonis]
MVPFLQAVLAAIRSAIDALLFQHRRPPGFD